MNGGVGQHLGYQRLFDGEECRSPGTELLKLRGLTSDAFDIYHLCVAITRRCTPSELAPGRARREAGRVPNRR
jgi:hypothetical protein